MSMARYFVGDVFARLEQMADNSVDFVMFSPPFIGLREYLPADHPDKHLEIGLEGTPAEFINTMLRLIAQLRRVLTETGSMVIEMGDTMAGSGGAGGDYYNEDGWRAAQPKPRGSAKITPRMRDGVERFDRPGTGQMRTKPDVPVPRPVGNGGDGWPLAKSKAMLPELLRVALAYGLNPLTSESSPAGLWRVRNVITWCRTNPPVGALGDKFRSATSDLLVACTSEDRWFDEVTCRVPASPNTNPRTAKDIDARELTGKAVAEERTGRGGHHGNFKTLATQHTSGATAPLLDWWVITAGGYRGDHFATYPAELCVAPIQTMCPRQVCTLCGEPRRPIVETPNAIGQATGRGAHLNGNAAGARAAGRDAIDRNDPRIPESSDKVITGWTHCHCSPDPDRPCTPTMWSTRTVPVLAPDGTQRLNKDGTPRTRQQRYVSDIGRCSGANHHRNGIVLDPFAGSGTTLQVSSGLGRDSVGIDIDERNAELARERCGMFLTVEP